MVAICCWVTAVADEAAVAIPLVTFPVAFLVNSVSGISDLISIGSSLAVTGDVIDPAEDDEDEDVDDTGETSVAVVVVVAGAMLAAPVAAVAV